MVAGLSVQVASLLLFMTLCFEFGWRAHKHHDQLNPKHASLYNSSQLKKYSSGFSNNDNFHPFRIPGR